MMTIVGIVLAILSIVISTIMDGNSFGALIGPSSLFLVVVGALGVTLSGTVIGLINMLGNLSDPEQLGLGLSVALLTTLYGVIFANLVFLPIGGKLSRLHSAEVAVKELALDGILALQAGASPRAIVERLEAFLPPETRVGLEGRSDKKAA